MKSRELKTVPLLVVADYKIIKQSSGKYLHSFHPASTDTLYQFEGAEGPILKNGRRYNISYFENGEKNWVDVSSIADAADVDPQESFLVSRTFGEKLREVETSKSRTRVTVKGGDPGNAYLGKKYAWRIYGMALARDTFDDLLAVIGHPTVACMTDGAPSIAYAESGIHDAMKRLFDSLIPKGGNRFSSPILPKRAWFQVKGVTAITDKK